MQRNTQYLEFKSSKPFSIRLLVAEFRKYKWFIIKEFTEQISRGGRFSLFLIVYKKIYLVRS